MNGSQRRALINFSSLGNLHFFILNNVKEDLPPSPQWRPSTDVHALVYIHMPTMGINPFCSARKLGQYWLQQATADLSGSYEKQIVMIHLLDSRQDIIGWPPSFFLSLAPTLCPVGVGCVVENVLSLL